MSVVALFTWIATVLFGLLLLVIWLMEYDREYQSEAATRLPIPVISAHALLGLGGLLLWAIYLLADEERVAWATVAVLTTVACLGLIMAVRWVGVYRRYGDPEPSLGRRVAVPRNGTSRCQSSSPTASWPSPPSVWCSSACSSRAEADLDRSF